MDTTNTIHTQIHYKMIEQLSAMNQSLKEEIEARKQVQQELEENNRILADALRVKSEFLSTMSHEIRTPLNIILGYTQLLEGASFSADELGQFQSIQFAANSLLHIVDQILQYARIDEDNVRVEEKEFDLCAMAENFLHAFEAKAKEKGLDFIFQFNLSCPKRFYGDEKKIQQVIFNIIGNALKFTDQGKVMVQISSEKQEEDIHWVKFHIEDTGLGMDKEELSTIFERFRQVQNDIRRSYGGVGLGLAICKKLVESMGGKIQVDSQKGKGSTFSITIPLRKQTDQTHQKLLDVNNQFDELLKGVHVLLVEDDRLNQELALRVLQRLGCIVDTAMDGESAVEKAVEHQYDVILMDLHMPVIDGFESAKRIIEAGVSAPILGFSADVLEQTRNKALEVGMKTMLPKPFIIEEIALTIKQLLVKEGCPH